MNDTWTWKWVVEVVLANAPALLGLWIAYKKLHRTMNSRLDELVEVTKKLAHAQGMEEARQAQQKELQP